MHSTTLVISRGRGIMIAGAPYEIIQEIALEFSEGFWTPKGRTTPCIPGDGKENVRKILFTLAHAYHSNSVPPNIAEKRAFRKFINDSIQHSDRM